MDEAGSIITQVISEAYDIYKRYQDRDAEQAEFGKFMRHLAQILEGVKDRVPQHARPVACDLAALVGVGSAKLAKYKSRGLATTLLHLHSERERRQAIVRGVQQLLPLLTLSVASASDARAAFDDLARRTVSLQGSSAEAAEHLRYLRAAMEAIRASAGTTSAAAVEDSIATLAQSMQRMHAESVEAVLEGCEAMQKNLGAGFDKVVESVTDLRSAVGSLSEQMLSSHSRLSGEVQDLREVVSAATSTISALSAVTAQLSGARGDEAVARGPYSDVEALLAPTSVSSFRTIASARGVEFEFDVPSRDEARGPYADVDALLAPTSVSSFRTVASARGLEAPAAASAASYSAAVASVADQLFLTACPLWGLPFTPEGPMRPVRLSCCRFIISDAACAAHCSNSTTCRFCRAKKTHDWAQPVVHGPTFKATTAVGKGVSFVRAIQVSRVVMAKVNIGQGDADSESSTESSFGGDSWEAGAVRQAVVNGTSITLKVVPIGGTYTRDDVIWVREVLSVTDAASMGIPNVCKLLGFCWTASELWLLMRRCDGSLADYVQTTARKRGRPGLPPLDVVTLGLSMCCALAAIHSRLRRMHLDVTPHNILLKRARTSSNGSARLWTALLSDFCLSDRLQGSSRKRAVHRRDLNWCSPTESMTGSRAKGTPGYAPPEQIARRGEARSDVYSLGMTLLYAATGAHPNPDNSRAGTDTHSIADAYLEDMAGTGGLGHRGDEPGPILPESLQLLLRKMTAFKVTSRPRVRIVLRELLSIHTMMTADGAVPQHFFVGRPLHDTTGDRATGPEAYLGEAFDDMYDSTSDSEEPRAGTSHASPAPAAGDSSQRLVSVALKGMRKVRIDHPTHAHADVQGSQAEDVQEPGSSTHHARQPSSALSVDDWVNLQAQGVDVAGAAAWHSIPWPHAGAGDSEAASVESTGNAAGDAVVRGGITAPTATRAAGASAIQTHDQAAGVVSVDQPEAEDPRVHVSSNGEACGGCTAVEHVLRRISESASRPSPVFDFGGATLHLTSDWKEEADSLVVRGKGGASQRRAQICRGAGTVSNVNLDLGERGMLVLHGDVDVEFRNTTIRGGSVYGMGPKCNMKLTDVRLENCLLNLRDRVTVDITRMRGTTCPLPANLEVAEHAPPDADLPPKRTHASVPRYMIALRGEGTNVHAASMRLDRGMRVFHGAKFTGDNVHVELSRYGQHCVTVQGAGARAELAYSSLTVDIDERGREDRCGVIADAGASVSVANTFVSEVSIGLRVQTGAHLQLEDCTVKAAVQGMVVCGEGTAVDAAGSHIRGGEMAISVDAASELTQRECDVGRVVNLTHPVPLDGPEEAAD